MIFCVRQDSDVFGDAIYLSELVEDHFVEQKICTITPTRSIINLQLSQDEKTLYVFLYDGRIQIVPIDGEVSETKFLRPSDTLGMEGSRFSYTDIDRDFAEDLLTNGAIIE